MNRIKRFGQQILLMTFAFWLLGCEQGIASGTLVFDGIHQFDGETALLGDVLVQAGTAEFLPESQVAGSVYVVGGTLMVNGIIGGDLVVLDGQVALGPQAIIRGDLRLGGTGQLEMAETAVIAGETITGITLPDTRTAAVGWDDTIRWLVGAVLLAGLGGLWARQQSRPLHNIAAAATTYWLVSSALGLLALLVLPVLLVMMAFTIVLLPLVLALGIVIFVVLGMGIVSLGEWLGHTLWRWGQRPVSPGWATFGGTLLLLLIFRIPWLGGVLFTGTAILLFGAVLLSRFGTRIYTPPAHLAQSADLITYARPTSKPKAKS